VYNQGSKGLIINYATAKSTTAVLMYILNGPTTLFVRVPPRTNLTLQSGIWYDIGAVNTWRYVGFTYDYNTGYQRLFVDGVKVKEGFLGKQEISTNYKVRNTNEYQ
jgi:hypothetical protein